MPEEEFDATWPPVVVSELVDHQQSVLYQIEGYLLYTGSKNKNISPTRLAGKTDVSLEIATDIFRQLSSTSALTLQQFKNTVSRSQYSIDVVACEKIFEAARTAAKSIKTYKKRQPTPTDAKPLITLPRDPEFAQVNPDDFEMYWLMPALTRKIKQAETKVVLLAPFLEKDGFNHLSDVLINAIKRGVDVTIVSRYLKDTTSYNYHVLERFSKNARSACEDTTSLSFVDYTSWDNTVPETKRVQNGATPLFTLHAKIILFDNTAAYIGSANFTDYGFEQYLEAGVLLEGPPVSSFDQLISFLLQSEAATDIQI